MRYLQNLQKKNELYYCYYINIADKDVNLLSFLLRERERERDQKH